MRFMHAYKLDQSLRSALSHLWGKSSSIGLIETNSRKQSLTSSKYGGKFKMDARNMLHFQCVCGEVVQAARWRNFSLMGQRYMGTVVEVPRWGLAGLLICPRQKGVAVSETLFQAWKAWRRQKDFANLYKEMRELSERKCESGVPWWPAISVGMTDKSGQVLIHLLVLLVGELFWHHDKPTAVAEQLHSFRELTSQQQAMSFTSVYHETVEAVKLMLRAMYLVALFSPCLIMGAFVEENSHFRTLWMHMLLRTLELAGPAFIKWGQWASTRPDIFPVDICDELAKLHMQAPRHSYAETREIVENAFRVPIEDIFDDFEEEPVASGSIAQIHRAVLRTPPGNGPPLLVAVKVRHPRVSKLIQRDFVIIKTLAKFSTSVPGLQHLQLDKSVQHFASFMTRQVDLTLEAAHLQRFIYNFRRWKNVSFPVPIYPFVHPTVLVETFEEGQTIANFVDTGSLSSVHSRLAYIGSSCLLKMLLEDNFVHGDLHPGNIFVRFNNNLPEVVLLDVGMTAELNPRSRGIMLEVFKAVAKKDGYAVADWTLQFAEDQTCPDPENFKRDVNAKFKEYLSVRGTASNTGECMMELFDQIRKHRVNMDGDVCTVMVTTLILEGWQRKLDPDLDVFQMLGDLLLKAEWAVSMQYIMSAIAAP
ncbi:hypothetical protein CY35_11G012500 [Sphagnum magellanicum]|nr:hypothetical protein CY35_11G012500 [Sphagnum magellanicum]